MDTQVDIGIKVTMGIQVNTSSYGYKDRYESIGKHEPIHAREEGEVKA